MSMFIFAYYKCISFVVYFNWRPTWGKNYIFGILEFGRKIGQDFLGKVICRDIVYVLNVWMSDAIWRLQDILSK